jgi:hypothetical protein
MTVPDEERRRMLWRLRKARQRERDRLGGKGDILDVTLPVTPAVSDWNSLPSVTEGKVTLPHMHARPHGDYKAHRDWLLTGVAVTLFATAVASNAAFSWSLGASDGARSVFAGIGVAADVLVFVLPSVAASKWRSGCRMASLATWSLYGPAFVFAVSGSIGFSALNIGDVTAVRAARTSPAIELAQRRLDVATAQVATECKRVGPLCRERQAEERQALADLAGARSMVARASDPQVAQASALVAWMTPLRPSENDFAMVRLALLTLLPQLGGLVLMVSRG